MDSEMVFVIAKLLLTSTNEDEQACAQMSMELYCTVRSLLVLCRV